ncbi:FG-GAP repeat domain-containing protein [Streptomyces pratensis]|uniref:FG-GAP repeat domain-containing protein n=1 Tax=Streptomyces pratensis TaxID=1169025 RepID=UPI001931A753|nr:VCBS repeat-containing protein [Streptomyces pratensis]
MRSPHSKRALTLASALVAAGLALASAPHALAAGTDSGSVMKLTGTQAEKLADHMGVDVYGDRAASDNTTADGRASSKGTSATSGGTAGGGSHLDAVGSGTTADNTPVTFTATSTMEGVRGLGVTVPAKGGQYFTVHSLGNIQLHNADGSTVWSRTNASLYTDWQVKPLQPWRVEPYPARIVMGYDAVSPFSPYSDQGYDTSDLTGDGVPDIVFSAAVGFSPTPRAFTSPGSSLPAGTFVTVMDGKTGKTLWSKLYSYVTNVKTVDGTLLLANSPRTNSNSPATETATLSGIRFSYADGALTPSSTWTYDTKETRGVSWSSLESVGSGRIAASWNLRKAEGVDAHGNTLVLDTADGSAAWRTDSDLYGRQLHLDAARDRVVALEQSDISDAVKYEIVSYDLKTGERTALDTRVNAMATAMTVGDAASGGGTEYAVSESTFDSALFVNSSTIRVLNGEDASTVKWAHTFKRAAENPGDGSNTWHMDSVGGKLVVSGQDAQGLGTAENPGGRRYGALTVFNAKGRIAWQQNGVSASPMFHESYRSGGKDFVRTVDQNQNIRTYKLGNGVQKAITPLQGALNYAQAVDLNGDKKKDVVAGGTSNGVWAWSGPSLVKGEPKQLWRATVAGEIHNITTGDVNGDGKPEVVVAADVATTVLDGATGNVLTTIDGAGQYVRSVTVADVNGDGKDEILVPTDALRVYNARGTQLWSYAAPAGAGDVVFSDTAVADGQVYTQYSSLGAINSASAVQNGVALDAAKGTVRWTADPKAPEQAFDGKLFGAALDHAVFASPAIPYADGHAVVYTWITRSDPTVAGELASATPRVVMEIRDGRTGEVLHQTLGGSPWSHDHYLIDDRNDLLYQLSYGTFRGFGANGADTSSSVVAPLRGVQFINGPGGRRLLAGGLEGGVGVWDPSVLTTGWQFQGGLGTGSLMGGRNYLAADLDGDGVDDMMSLNSDDFGRNRMADQLGGGVLSLNNAIQQTTTYTLY